MKKKQLTVGVIGSVCGITALAGDFAVTTIVGFFYKSYHLLYESESMLGTSNSPVANYMNGWGIVFSFLLLVFSFALRKTIFSKGKWPKLAAWLILVYGLGEGIGSALFPYDFVGSYPTRSAIIHNVLGDIGDAAMILLPYVLLRFTRQSNYYAMNSYAWFAGISGPLLILCFALAGKHVPGLRGLWQRLYLLDYYLLMVIVAFKMYNECLRRKAAC